MDITGYLHRKWHVQHRDLLSHRIQCYWIHEDYSSLSAKRGWQLFIYYLWVVSPFCHSLDLLALNKDPRSPFHWPKEKGSWASVKLHNALKREFQTCLGQTMKIPIYTHISIAISRKHLACGGFKRDYGLEDTKFDSQSGHGSWKAECIYA